MFHVEQLRETALMVKLISRCIGQRKPYQEGFDFQHLLLNGCPSSMPLDGYKKQ
jgi:hypothetical protein